MSRLENDEIKLTTDGGIAVKVTTLLDGKKDTMKGDDVAVNYICDCAISIPFTPGSPLEMLVAMKDFKQYFTDLRKAEGTDK